MEAGLVTEPTPLSDEERWGGENLTGVCCSRECQGLTEVPLAHSRGHL